MDDRVLAAAENNARWCDVVCRAHGIATAMHSAHWAALRRPPEGYPDAVTLRPQAASEDVLRCAQDGPGCAVKDSFAALDLAPLGFDELFRASWIFRAAARAHASPEGWTVVAPGAELAEWTGAAGCSEAVGDDVLRDPSVRILAARGRDGLRAGAIANRTGAVVGVSNVFATSMPAGEAWSGIAGALARLFGPLPLVGYERGDALDAALAAGFEPIGSLRVWLRAS